MNRLLTAGATKLSNGVNESFVEVRSPAETRFGIRSEDEAWVPFELMLLIRDDSGRFTRNVMVFLLVLRSDWFEMGLKQSAGIHLCRIPTPGTARTAQRLENKQLEREREGQINDYH